MRPRILIVDDEDSITFALRRFFEARGLDVDCAQELEEAEAMLVHDRYAVVIADLRLTGVHGAEGLELLNCVRERSPWTRSILLTAYGSAELESEALRRGADLVLHKPRPLDSLAQEVFALIREAD